METVRFASSAIDAAAYDAAHRRLGLRYHGGGSYLYHDVSRAEFEELKAAPSAGEFVNRHIKPRHRCEILKRA